MAARLTTSSYAVLGWLTLRSWSGYELAQQAKRSLRFVWPKSESHLYAEPKKLVELGLAKVHTESAGASRTRQIYGITPEGRQAFKAWLSTEPTPPQLEAEALLRLLFADQGDRDDMLGTLATFESQVQAIYDDGRAQVAGYLRGEGGDAPMFERLHLVALYVAFQGDFYRLMLRWIAYAREEISEWDSMADLGMTEQARQVFEAAVEGRSVL